MASASVKDSFISLGSPCKGLAGKPGNLTSYSKRSLKNQLNQTDHDHLGKLLTYLSNLDAKIAIWISTNPRPEHVTVINYLNEVVPQDTKFYLLKVQAFKIGDSEPAPLFSIEAGPSKERTEAGEAKKDFAEQDEKRYEFFDQLLALCNQKTNLFSSISPVGYQH